MIILAGHRWVLSNPDDGAVGFGNDHATMLDRFAAPGDEQVSMHAEEVLRESVGAAAAHIADGDLFLVGRMVGNSHSLNGNVLDS